MKTPEEWSKRWFDGDQMKAGSRLGFARAIQEDTVRAAQAKIMAANVMGHTKGVLATAVGSLLEPKKPREVCVPKELTIGEEYFIFGMDEMTRFDRTDRTDDRGRVIYEEVL